MHSSTFSVLSILRCCINRKYLLSDEKRISIPATNYWVTERNARGYEVIQCQMRAVIAQSV
jgi:hypothetical protein